MKRKLILSNFRPETTEEELVDLFADYELEKVVLKPGKYAVLTFKNHWNAGDAMNDMGNGKLVLWGYWLRLKFADR
jgi:RNA recognition motif. (a.k.a. RRM, RBD, or RNP domain)